MTMTVKNAGVYSNITTIFQKQYGTYFPVNDVYIKQAGAYVSEGFTWNNGPSLSVVSPIGSSTTLFTFSSSTYAGDQNMNVRKRMCEMSVDLPLVLTYGVDGGTIESADASIESGLANINAAEALAKGIKIGFPICIGSNNILSETFASASQSKLDSMTAGLTSIVAKVRAAGHEPILGTINPRMLDFAIYNDWNTYFIKPLIASLTPDWLDPNGNPVYDLEWLYRFHQAEYGTSWYYSDGVHPSSIAIEFIQKYVAQQFGRYARSPRLINQSKSIIMAFGGFRNDLNYGGFNREYVVDTGGSHFYSSFTTLYDRRGDVYPGATLTTTGIASRSNTGKGNTGTWTVGLEHHAIQSGWSYNTSNTPITINLSMGVGNAGKTGTVYITLSTSTGIGSTYTVAGHASQTLQGNLTGVQKISFPLLLDSSGNHTITVTRGFGNYYIAISGVEYEWS